jgi:hypothetical protein
MKIGAAPAHSGAQGHVWSPHLLLRIPVPDVPCMVIAKGGPLRIFLRKARQPVAQPSAIQGLVEQVTILGMALEETIPFVPVRETQQGLTPS